MRDIRLVIPFITVLLFVALPVGKLMESTAAQSGESAKLFVQVDASKADLTPAQEQALARIRQSKTAAETQLVRVRTSLLVPSPLSVKINVGRGNDFEVMTTE